MSEKPIKSIAITGAAGQIAYSLLFRLAKGELYGADQPLALHLIDLPESLGLLESVAMELEDSAFDLLRSIKVTSDPKEGFAGVDFIFLLGASPRGPGMERSDLLLQNAAIFVEQGKAAERANPDVRVLVVGNPCNSNALVFSKYARSIGPRHIHAMSRLDQNRARAFLAKKAAIPLQKVSPLIIWGNHSPTLVPDFNHTDLDGKRATESIDRAWLENEFFESVRQRGAAVIRARGKSSAASAASSALDAAYSMIHPTPEGDFYSSIIYSEGNGYGIDGGLYFSFPCRTNLDLSCDLVEGFSWDPYIEKKIRLSESELLTERSQIMKFIKPS